MLSRQYGKTLADVVGNVGTDGTFTGFSLTDWRAKKTGYVRFVPKVSSVLAWVQFKIGLINLSGLSAQGLLSARVKFYLRSIRLRFQRLFPQQGEMQ